MYKTRAYIDRETLIYVVSFILYVLLFRKNVRHFFSLENIYLQRHFRKELLTINRDIFNSNYKDEVKFDRHEREIILSFFSVSSYQRREAVVFGSTNYSSMYYRCPCIIIY